MGKLDDDVLVEAAEKGLFYRKRIGVLPETGATGGVLCAPDLANVGLPGYSPETTAAAAAAETMSSLTIVVVVVKAESFSEEEGRAFCEEGVWSKEAEMEEELLQRETDGGGMG